MRTIRTQGKHAIVAVDHVTNICVAGYDIDANATAKIIACFHGEEHAILGAYKTSARRSKVLDMLESWLSMEGAFYEMPYVSICQLPLDNEKDKLRSFVSFQMPDDDEQLDYLN